MQAVVYIACAVRHSSKSLGQSVLWLRSEEMIPLQKVSWVKYLRLEQWQRPRDAHVPPFASAFPEHFFLEPGARGASGGSDDCSAFSFWMLPSMLTAENDLVVLDSSGPELRELSRLWLDRSTIPPTSCLLNGFGGKPWKNTLDCCCCCCCCRSRCCWMLCCTRWNCRCSWNCWLWWSRACVPLPLPFDEPWPWPELSPPDGGELWVGNTWSIQKSFTL